MNEALSISEREGKPYCFVGLVLSVPVVELDEVDGLLASLPKSIRVIYRKLSMDYLKVSEVKSGETI